MTEQNLNQINNFTPNPAKRGNQSKKLIFLILVCLILIVAAGLFYSFFSIQNEPPVADTTETKTTPDINKIIVAKAEVGELVEGFPSDLIVDKDAIITGSAENVSNDPKVQFLVTTYKTNLSSSVIYQRYKNYFESNDWNIKILDSSNQFPLYANNITGGQLSIQFVKEEGSNLIFILFYKIR